MCLCVFYSIFQANLTHIFHIQIDEPAYNRIDIRQKSPHVVIPAILKRESILQCSGFPIGALGNDDSIKMLVLHPQILRRSPLLEHPSPPSEQIGEGTGEEMQAAVHSPFSLQRDRGNAPGVL